MSDSVKTDTRQLLATAHEWILKLEEPNASLTTREQFTHWLNASPRHKDIFDQAYTVKAALATLHEEDFDKDVHSLTLSEKITAFTDNLASVFADMRVRFAAGAATAMVCMLFIWLIFPFLSTTPTSPEMTQHYQTDIGETATFSLADGTELTLGAASQVETVYSRDNRRVELIRGSVFVDVARDLDRPFSVYSGKLTATALGTAFDVRQSPDMHRVAVAEGRVEVTWQPPLNGGAIAILHRQQLDAGQEIAASISTGLEPARQVKPEDIGAWQEDRLIYKGATLTEVLADANRYAALPIVIASDSQDLGKLQLRGVFQGKDIDRLLTTIAQIHDIDIDRAGDKQITLRKNQK